MYLESTYIKAVRRLLRPLARSFIARGLTLPIVLNLLKQAMVQVVEEMPMQEKRQTDSRISLITGVHRKDVRTIRESGSVKLGVSTLNARTIAEWTANPKFLHPDGTPAVLAKTGSGSFEDLVASVSKDIRPRTLLDEWLSRGIVSIVEGNKIAVSIQDYSPSHSEEEMLHFFGENLADHIETATHNMEHPSDRLFERAAYSDGLSAGSIEKLEDVARDMAMSSLLEINKMAFKLAQQDKSKKDAKHRFRFGAYFYRNATANDLSLEAPSKTNKEPEKSSPKETSL